MQLCPKTAGDLATSLAVPLPPCATECHHGPVFPKLDDHSHALPPRTHPHCQELSTTSIGGNQQRWIQWQKKVAASIVGYRLPSSLLAACYPIADLGSRSAEDQTKPGVVHIPSLPTQPKDSMLPAPNIRWFCNIYWLLWWVHSKQNHLLIIFLHFNCVIFIVRTLNFCCKTLYKKCLSLALHGSQTASWSVQFALCIFLMYLFPHYKGQKSFFTVLTRQAKHTLWKIENGQLLIISHSRIICHHYEAPWSAILRYIPQGQTNITYLFVFSGLVEWVWHMGNLINIAACF